MFLNRDWRGIIVPAIAAAALLHPGQQPAMKVPPGSLNRPVLVRAARLTTQPDGHVHTQPLAGDPKERTTARTMARLTTTSRGGPTRRWVLISMTKARVLVDRHAAK